MVTRLTNVISVYVQFRVNPLLQIAKLGQSIWLDNFSRTLLREGGLKRLIAEDAITGVTPNPAIFYKAVSECPYYRKELEWLRESKLNPEERYESMVITDIREACDILRPVFEESDGDDGYISLDVSPFSAQNVWGIVQAGRRLNNTVCRPNLLIKVPATYQGCLAIEELTAIGINVNVTLMFSLLHVDRVAESYIRGARRWVDSGGNPRKLKSVASLFLSRLDAAVDMKLEQIGMEEILSLRGRTSIALAKLAYHRYREIFHSAKFTDLAALGVRPQNLLWASTSTKNPAYSDVHYVEPLIGPETINTLTDATITAFRVKGKAELTIEQDQGDSAWWLATLSNLGVDMDALGEQLQLEGLKTFESAYGRLLELTA